MKPSPSPRKASLRLQICIGAVVATWSVFLCSAHAAMAKNSSAVRAEETMSVQAAVESAQSRDLSARETQVDSETDTFYRTRNYSLAWSGSEEAAARASTVRQVLENAGQQGLRSADYLSSLSADPGDAPDAGQDAADFDVAMTRAIIRYALDVRIGRTDPTNVYKDVDLPPREFAAGSALAEALQRNDLGAFLDDLPPPQPGYRALVDALAHYRAIAEKGGWPGVTARSAITDKNGKPGVLAVRLALEDPELANLPAPDDGQVHDALLRFQQRNGIEPNGKLNAETLKALNVPAAVRVDEIIANMERWRWLPRTFESRYILVNVPDQSLDYMDGQDSKLHSRIIIGKKATPTPIMKADVQAVVVNPPWDIPDDIAAAEILPKLQHDSDYLEKRNMVLVDAPDGDPHGLTVDWKHMRAADLHYQFQQVAGPGNALGQLMLDAPNAFGVYMHGTSNPKLFLSDTREVSHGCVRVEKIGALASLALGSDEAGLYAGEGDDAIPDDVDPDIEIAIASGGTERLPLTEPLPVYMLYWTAIGGPDGTAGFRPDRYDRDPPLLAQLKEPRTTNDASDASIPTQ